ncbi:hypothetical protein V8E54_009137 [Elaphomyces granulatus]
MVSPIDNLLQYVRIKTTFIAAQMSESDAQHIIEHIIGEGSIGNVGGDMKDPLQSPAFPDDHCFDIDRLSTCELVPSMIEDGDPEWVLKWWKANTFAYPLMA